MAFRSDVFALWRFDGTLYDEAANHDFLLNNNDPYTPGPVTTAGYIDVRKFDFWTNKNRTTSFLSLGQSATYEAELPSYTNGDFTISFWWYQPDALGFVRHAVTRAKEPRTAAVLAKADKYVDSGLETLDFGTFAIVEKAATEDTNKMSLLITGDGGDVDSTVESNGYTPGLHHFLVTLDTKRSYARFFLDGIPCTGASVSVTPMAFSSTLKLNAINPNYTAHQVSPVTAGIRDLLFRSGYASDDSMALRAYTLGVDYIADEQMSDIHVQVFPIPYTRPSTVETNAIRSDGGAVYLFRSNGEILKGEQPFWDNQLDFSSEGKNAALTAVGQPSYTTDGMVLSGAFVRI